MERCTHMCLLNQRLLLIEAGGLDMGRTGSAWLLSYEKTVAGKLRRPHTSAFTTSDPEYHMNEQ